MLGAAVLSRWVLDIVSHRPDMPVLPGGLFIGLGLWHSVPLTLAVELPMFGAGIWLYARARTIGSPVVLGAHCVERRPTIRDRDGFGMRDGFGIQDSGFQDSGWGFRIRD